MSAADARLIGEEERTRHKAATARGEAPADVVACEAPGCPRAALQGPLCLDHRPEVASWVPGFLSDVEIARVSIELDAVATPLFILAMEYIARGQLARMGVAIEAGG